jgi:hypothetical protein
LIKNIINENAKIINENATKFANKIRINWHSIYKKLGKGPKTCKITRNDLLKSNKVKLCVEIIFLAQTNK